MFTATHLKSLVVGGAVAAALLTAASPAAAETVLSDGHVDVGPIVVDGSWQVQVRNDSVVPEQWLPLADVTFQVPDTAQLAVPDSPDFAFLGAPGSPVWLLPQTQQAGLLWPGWNTQHESVRDDLDGPVTWSWDAVRGPGTLILFLDGSFGSPEVMFDSARPFPQQTAIDPNVHVHGNWAFSAPGRYEIDLTMAGSLAGAPVTDSRTLAIQVGPAAAVETSVESAPVESAPVESAPGESVVTESAATEQPASPSATSDSSVSAAPSVEAEPTMTSTAEPSSGADAPGAQDTAEGGGSSAGTWWLVGSVAAVVIVAVLVIVLIRRARR